MASACHVCRYTGERECDPQAADIKCLLCGRCSAESLTSTGEPLPSDPVQPC